MTASPTSQPPPIVTDVPAERHPKPPLVPGQLPTVTTDLQPSDILDRLSTASRRGRLAGYEPRGHGGLFSVAAHGHPFDAVLIARHHPGRLTFELLILRKLPAIFAAALLFSIWPGVWFMDELVAQFFPGWWHPWVTYYWYLPITIIPLPWVWRSMMGKSRASTSESAREAITKIAAELGARTEP